MEKVTQVNAYTYYTGTALYVIDLVYKASRYVLKKNVPGRSRLLIPDAITGAPLLDLGCCCCNILLDDADDEVFVAVDEAEAPRASDVLYFSSRTKSLEVPPPPLPPEFGLADDVLLVLPPPKRLLIKSLLLAVFEFMLALEVDLASPPPRPAKRSSSSSFFSTLGVDLLK